MGPEAGVAPMGGGTPVPMGPDPYGMPDQPPFPREWPEELFPPGQGPGMADPAWAGARPGHGATPEQLRMDSQDKWQQKRREQQPRDEAWAQNRSEATRGTHFQ